jgi:hypothetical protein
MPRISTVPKPQPCGTKLVRLRDVPLAERQRAYHHLVRTSVVSPEEAEALLDLIIDPGDKGGRVAA